MANPEEAKLDQFLQWLQLNGAELRGCKIKYCDSNKGFGLFFSNDVSDGILLVVPLDLAITPMRVLQDPILGPECSAMFEEGEVDDRFLMILFLTIERLRKNSSWKPYLDMLPTTFGNPLWFTDDDLLELKGTTVYRATELQKKKLHSLYDDKVKNLVNKLLVLNGETESEVYFEDFLWANSIFWTRAMNIPFPRSYVFPQVQDEKDNTFSSFNGNPEPSTSIISSEELVDEKGADVHEVEGRVPGVTSASIKGETVWVEGLVPGIDFCNHDLNAAATWEVDGKGLTTGIPYSMYLLSAGQSDLQIDKEISISYGNNGNEELLYLYGFVIDNNPDDYVMVHYPSEAIQSVAFFDSKAQLLEAQKAELRCLLPRSLLDHGFFPGDTRQKQSSHKCTIDRVSNYSWCGQRKMPSYVSQLVFPEDFLTALRTIAMQEDELYQVSSLLQELVGSGGERQPTDEEVRAAIWEACGDSGALQLLVDLLNMKVVDLEEGSGTEDNDTELLQKAQSSDISEGHESCQTNGSIMPESMSKKRWSSIVYRRGQKQLTRLFLKEAEHALQLALSEGN
ncbi:protein-lysine N-methyltransferase EFM1 isoform X1 [Actinidia eriantha]|uniref:protein-lysine N-methyltransferase EFM1 isoform X1 n=1 Tax=Actinidia eriantha TaxID=165200 RepID=UPI0025850CB0|nr:protein-lysine N-methyltransferase EFM1 isoform X1 [Actinidia eriantha]